MFEAEAKGLMILAENSIFTIPYPYKYGRCQGKAYLLLEFVSAIGKNQTYWADLGEQLADLHKNTYQKFGLIFNNFIGELPQSNELMDSWVSFFIEKRLKVQAGLAYYNGLIGQKLLLSFEKLYKILPDILPEESPSLLHGDLWSGNLLVGNVGEPCLIDPAIYYGHREVEIAFTQLFGGFDKQFYEAYQYVYPLYPNFQERVDIYNIYPLLVHTNLFGTSYLSSVENTLKKFV
jgi:fructosamine-3-kinase